MKRLQITSLVCGGFLSLASNGLLAQQPSATTSPSATSPSTSDPSLTQSPSSSSLGTASSSSIGATSSSMSSGNQIRLSHILNTTVQSQEGKTLGYLRDLTVDPQSGRVDFAILSLSNTGGSTDTATSGRETVPSSRSTVSGIPSSAVGYTTTGKLIPVPWQLFSQSWSGSASSTSLTPPGASAMGHPLVLNIDESKLRSAPSFDASNWNELQSGSFDQRSYSYFGVDRSSAMGTSGSSISGQGTSGTYDTRHPHNSSIPDSSTTSPNK